MTRKFLATLVAGAFAVAAGGLSSAAHAAGGHDHDPHGAAHALKLNAGKKWATDEALREGMTKIRDAVDADLSAIHRGKLSSAQYDALGARIETQVGYIVSHCKLDPQADERLHVILADLGAGNEVLRGQKPGVRRSAGVVKVVQALDRYAEYFEHPGWKAPKAAH